MAYNIQENFQSKTVALIQLVNGNDKFKIPEFQRAYSWTPKQEILTFLNDILDAKYSSEAIDSSFNSYFIGPIITYQEDKSSQHLIIDGQQRFTTIILVITALRDLLKQVENPAYMEYDGYLNYSDKTLAGQQKKETRLTLSNRDSKKYFDELISTEKPIDLYMEGDAEKLDNAYTFIKNYIGSQDYGLSGEEQEALEYVNFLLNNTGLTWIQAGDLDQSLMVFERMNFRGKDLSTSDLIKYYLFTGKSLDDLGEDTKKIETKWDNLKKQLSKGEKSKYPKLDRFFKYFITSRYLEKGVLQEKKIIEWIKNEDKRNNLKIASNPIEFLDYLESEMTDYVNILQKRYPSNINLTENSIYLRRLSSFGKEIRQHLPILLAASREKYNKEEYDYLCSAIENLAFVWKLTKSQWNEVEKNLSDWCTQIRNGVPVQEFVENNIVRLIKTKTNDISEELRDMKEKNKTLTKYLLVRIEHHLREQMKMPFELWNWSKGGVLELEHILPERFLDESIPKGKSRSIMDSLVWDIGNLTLLTPYSNNAANNDPVKSKFENNTYKNSQYIISQTIQSENFEYKSKKATKGQRKHLTRLDQQPIILTDGLWANEQIKQRRIFYIKVLNEILFGTESKLILKTK